jgi:hypothetical protein
MLELAITSPYLTVVSEVQLFTPMPMNANECFPNYSKIEQPIGKGRVQGRGREEVGADFMYQSPYS